MKRVVSLLVIFLFVVAACAQAQERSKPVSGSASASAGLAKSGAVFGQASMNKAAAAVVRTTPSAPRGSGKSFFKTPWPYVIVAAVVVAVLIGTRGSSSGIGPY